MKSYSPYDNVEAKDYPALLVTGGLNDPRVQYWEPAKWVAKLRATKTDEHLLVLKMEMGAGHSGPSGRYDAWRDEAFVLAFLLDQLSLLPDPLTSAVGGPPAPQCFATPWRRRPLRSNRRAAATSGRRRPGRRRTRPLTQRWWRSSSGRRADVLGLVALAAGADVELDLLTLFEGAVTRPLDRGEVDEHVVATLAGDEAEALLRIEEFHSACSQLLVPSFPGTGPTDATSEPKA